MPQVFLMYALFASIFTVGKVALNVSPPYFLTGTRMLLAAFCIFAYLLIYKPKLLRLKRCYWIPLLWVAFFNVFITNAFEFWGLQYMSAGKTCLIYSLSPFIAAGIGYVMGTEKITYKKNLGLFIGILAFLPMMLLPWFDEGHANSTIELWAECALMISAVTSVIGWIFVKKLITKDQLDPLVINGYSFFLAGVMCFLTSLSIEQGSFWPVSESQEFIWSVLYIVIIHNLICYHIYATSLKRFSVTFMAFAGLSNPLFAAVTGRFFLNESITLPFWIALVGIAIGLYLFYVEEMKRVEIRL